MLLHNFFIEVPTNVKFGELLIYVSLKILIENYEDRMATTHNAHTTVVQLVYFWVITTLVN